jgi:hypothetical protein
VVRDYHAALYAPFIRHVRQEPQIEKRRILEPTKKNRRKRTARPCVVYYQSERPLREERGMSPQGGAWRSRCGAVVTTTERIRRFALWCISTLTLSCHPFFICKLPVDPTGPRRRLGRESRHREGHYALVLAEFKVVLPAVVHYCTNAGKTLQECKKVQTDRTSEPEFKRGATRRMSF